MSGSIAETVASLAGVNCKMAAFYFLRLREIIMLELVCEVDQVFACESEVDESDLGGKRKGKRGAAGKVYSDGFGRLP